MDYNLVIPFGYYVFCCRYLESTRETSGTDRKSFFRRFPVPLAATVSGVILLRWCQPMVQLTHMKYALDVSQICGKSSFWKLSSIACEAGCQSISYPADSVGFGADFQVLSF